MKIEYKTGDILSASTDIIAHQVNCLGTFNSGLARVIKSLYPEVYQKYRQLYEAAKDSSTLLGAIQLIPTSDGHKICNIFGQIYEDTCPEATTSYDAVAKALKRLCLIMLDFGYKSLAIPYKMGSHRAMGDWNVVIMLINSVFRTTDITIEIWKLK